MNIIYKNTDFTLPVHVVDSDGIIPIEDLEVLNIKVFTTDISTCITFDKTDLDVSGNLHIDASTMADCENGLVYYKYQAAYPDTAWEDGVYDVARIVQTDNYFKYHDNAPAHKTTCATAVSELVNDVHYATEAWVNQQISEAADASVDLTNYYTKSEVDNLIPDTSGFITVSALSDYATKTDISTFVTATDLSTAIAGIDASVDLSNYYTKSEVNNLIPDTTDFITVSALSDYATKTDISTFVTTTDLSTAIADVSVDMSSYYTKTEVNQIVEDLVLGDVSINLSDYVTKQELEDSEEVTSTAITDLYQKVTDLSTAIADVSVDMSAYYTKSEVDQKIADISIGDVSINIDTSNFIQKANNQPVNKIWVGTENEYQALSGFSNDTLYFVKENV